MSCFLRGLFYFTGMENQVKSPAHQESLIPRQGGYRHLKTFQIAEIIYDVTVRFCDTYISKRSRTHDQMVQAARSGKQNIAEGSAVSGTSKKMEMKLTNVARASLAELKGDYEDFLRQKSLALWENEEPLRRELVALKPENADQVAQWVLQVASRYGRYGLNGKTIQSIPSMVLERKAFPEISANAMHVLIGVTMALLDRQIKAQARRFEEDGGFTERLYRARQNFRKSLRSNE